MDFFNLVYMYYVMNGPDETRHLPYCTCNIVKFINCLNGEILRQKTISDGRAYPDIRRMLLRPRAIENSKLDQVLIEIRV